MPTMPAQAPTLSRSSGVICPSPPLCAMHVRHSVSIRPDNQQAKRWQGERLFGCSHGMPWTTAAEIDTAFTSIISCETSLLSCSYVRNFTCGQAKNHFSNIVLSLMVLGPHHAAMTGSLRNSTRRLVGHDADAVGQVASHHARQPLCLRDVAQPLPHAAVHLRISGSGGEQAPAAGRGRLPLTQCVPCAASLHRDSVALQSDAQSAVHKETLGHLPSDCPGFASGSSAAPAAPLLCETCAAAAAILMHNRDAAANRDGGESLEVLPGCRARCASSMPAAAWDPADTASRFSLSGRPPEGMTHPHIAAEASRPKGQQDAGGKRLKALDCLAETW